MASRFAAEAVNDRLWTCMSVRIVIAVTTTSPETAPLKNAAIALPRLLASASVSSASFHV